MRRTLLLAALAGLLCCAVAQPEGGEYDWDSVADMADSKNGTSKFWAVLQALEAAPEAADLLGILTNGTTVATVFVPLDEFMPADVDVLLEEPIAPETLAALLDVVKYHVYFGEALDLDDLVDGLDMQTALEGPEGVLKVAKAEGQQKPDIVTSTGEKVKVYQYDILAGAASVFTIKGLLRAGSPAPAPAF